MDKQSRELFEQREAIQYLVEDNELACMELDVQLGKIQRLLKLDEKYAGIRSAEAPSLIFAHLCEILQRKHLAEMEFIRERTNRAYLRSKARELWQK